MGGGKDLGVEDVNEGDLKCGEVNSLLAPTVLLSLRRSKCAEKTSSAANHGQLS